MPTPPHDRLVTLLRENPAGPFPPAADRTAWERITRTPHGALIGAWVKNEAEQYRSSPITPPLASDYLAFTRTGDRRNSFEPRLNGLVHRLETLALAECFEGRGRYMDRVMDAFWFLCEQTTWVWPAHEGASLPDPRRLNIDLAAAMFGLTVAEVLHLLGPELDAIHPRIRERARYELDRRIFTPYMERDDFWWLYPHPPRKKLNNWTGVCSGAVLCAALTVLDDDPERLASLVERAAWSLGFFLESFGEQGSLDEGVGYWCFGVSYFTFAAERALARTGGAVNLLDHPRMDGIARFPNRARLYDDRFIEFSDCDPFQKPEPGWLWWLGNRVDEDGLRDWAARLSHEEEPLCIGRKGRLAYVLRNLFWLPEEGLVAGLPEISARKRERSVYLPDVEWMISRSDRSENALILAAKGGHNAESHNHNDIGAFVLHYRQHALLTELGRPTYTRQFFQAGTRYQNLCARSLGHPVPLVNGVEQQPGETFHAEVLEQASMEEEDRLRLDLAPAYPPEAGVNTLTRTLTLERNGAEGRVTLEDVAEFAGHDGTLALPLYTLNHRLEVREPGRAVIEAPRATLEIRYDPEVVTARAEEVPVDDPKFVTPDGKNRIRRLWLETQAKEGRAFLSVRFQPKTSVGEGA
ncbi:MAG: heparinase II/III-family protein [Armatimonadetes bacterium]|nr:heparinase II/III-family protein [Armatimonadota bacterium]